MVTVTFDHECETPHNGMDYLRRNLYLLDYKAHFSARAASASLYFCKLCFLEEFLLGRILALGLKLKLKVLLRCLEFKPISIS